VTHNFPAVSEWQPVNGQGSQVPSPIGYDALIGIIKPILVEIFFWEKLRLMGNSAIEHQVRKAKRSGKLLQSFFVSDQAIAIENDLVFAQIIDSIEYRNIYQGVTGVEEL